MNESNILLYETDEGKINVDVILKDETIWLTQKSMAELFECSTDNIGLHLKNIFEEDELDKNLTTEKISVVRKEGSRNVKRELEFYNLDAIIAVGYRVNSKKLEYGPQGLRKIIRFINVITYYISCKRYVFMTYF